MTANGVLYPSVVGVDIDLLSGGIDKAFPFLSRLFRQKPCTQGLTEIEIKVSEIFS